MQWPTSDTSCVGTFGDPKLAPLAENNGNTPTLALTNGSAAINTGIDSICAANPVSNNSQNGVLRPFGPHCDIGAFELDYLSVKNITRIDQDPTNANQVNFSVEFSEPVTGVDLKDFSLTTSGVSQASIVSLSGSGAIYTVSVSTGINSGTIRLDVIDNDSIQSLDGTPLGLRGIGNGTFTSGEFYAIDKTPPKVVSITLANPSPNNTQNVGFIVTFSESVSGVDSTDFKLSTDGLTGTALSSVSGSGKIYTVTVTTGSGDGVLHLDLIDDDTITDIIQNPLGGLGLTNGNYTTGETYSIKEGPIFLDVDPEHFAFQWVESLYNAGITKGCSIDPLNYCPNNSVTRAQMAIFLEKGKRGSAFIPEPATGTIFADVAKDDFAAEWIELLFADGVTAGCSGGNYCPSNPVTRAQMAIFLLKAKYGQDYTPPENITSTGFDDVAIGDFASYWITQLVNEGITAGCGGGNYCPTEPVTRAQMAIFLVRTFNLP